MIALVGFTSEAYLLQLAQEATSAPDVLAVIRSSDTLLESDTAEVIVKKALEFNNDLTPKDWLEISQKVDSPGWVKRVTREKAAFVRK